MLKKIFSAALALTLLAGLLIPVSAAAHITLGKPQAVTVVDDEVPVIFQFTPSNTGHYIFYSYNSGKDDPFGYIMDENWEMLADGDDTEDGMDFVISCPMTAGKTYYLAATCYSGSAEYTVQIDALVMPEKLLFDRASYTGKMCAVLYPQISFAPEGCAQEAFTVSSSDERIVYIDEYGDFYLGIPGTATVTATSESGLTATCTVTVEAPAALPLDTPWTLDAAKGDQYLQFTAPADGWYGIHSSGDEIDSRVDILDKNLDGITGDDDGLTDGNFFAPVYLETGELCYFGFGTDNLTGTAEVVLQKLSAATAITLPQDRITGYVDTLCQLTPVYAPQIAIPEELSWKSSNEDVAYVDDAGCVSFLAPGNAVITVTSQTGKTDSVAVTVGSAPADLTAWGICGPNLQWQLSGAGVLTVTGTGDMYDRDNNPCHWQEHSERITQVVLPEGITGIGAYAFQGCANLTQMEIPDSVRRIGSNAFDSCYALTRITLPPELDSLGAYAFGYCMELEQVALPGNLKRIPRALFEGCFSLSQVTLPGTLISIGDDAFSGCAIEQITLPEGLQTIGHGAFANAALTELVLPESLTELRDYALLNCPIQKLTVPAGVTKLGCGFVSADQVSSIQFLGDAPVFDAYALDYLEITAYYPAGNSTWTEEVRQNYGGNVIWEPYGNPGVSLSGAVSAAGTVTLTLAETKETVIAENGSYTFRNLQPGTYTLTVSAANHVTRTYRIIVEDSDLTQNVKLHMIGDIDGNGKVNTGDVAKLNAHLKGTNLLTDEYMLTCANVNGGSLNMGDTAALYAHIKGTKILY